MSKDLEIHDLEIVELPSTDKFAQFNVYFDSRLICTFLETSDIINPFILILDGESKKYQTEEKLFETICKIAAS